ncbi:hypothetical protein BJP39_01515 [Streptomyces sp. CC77]|nr:hypothetical protein BJP39_01515 [Streptomyces sp. CC77]
MKLLTLRAWKVPVRVLPVAATKCLNVPPPLAAWCLRVKAPVPSTVMMSPFAALAWEPSGEPMFWVRKSSPTC